MNYFLRKSSKNDVWRNATEFPTIFFWRIWKPEGPWGLIQKRDHLEPQGGSAACRGELPCLGWAPSARPLRVSPATFLPHTPREATTWCAQLLPSPRPAHGLRMQVGGREVQGQRVEMTNQEMSLGGNRKAFPNNSCCHVCHQLPDCVSVCMNVLLRVYSASYLLYNFP
jgi:hypothetical protein